MINISIIFSDLCDSMYNSYDICYVVTYVTYTISIVLNIIGNYTSNFLYTKTDFWKWFDAEISITRNSIIISSLHIIYTSFLDNSATSFHHTVHTLNISVSSSNMCEECNIFVEMINVHLYTSHLLCFTMILLLAYTRLSLATIMVLPPSSPTVTSPLPANRIDIVICAAFAIKCLPVFKCLKAFAWVNNYLITDH